MLANEIAKVLKESLDLYVVKHLNRLIYDNTEPSKDKVEESLFNLKHVAIIRRLSIEIANQFEKRINEEFDRPIGTSILNSPLQELKVARSISQES